MKRFRLFSTDLDGTVVGKPDATLAFRLAWDSIPKERRPLLCYNSGRLLEHTLELLRESDLPESDYLICGVGTLIHDAKEKKVLKEFSATLTGGWDKEKVREVMLRYPEAREQPGRYQHKFKSSWYIYDAGPDKIEAIEKELEEAGLKITLVYSSSRDLDVLPEYANKGNALLWLADMLGIDESEILVAGDTGNDISMFQPDHVAGIAVENAQPELLAATVNKEVFKATEPFADGVLQGLLHFGVIAEIPDMTGRQVKNRSYSPQIRAVLKSEVFGKLDKQQIEYLDLAYEKAVAALKKNITPLGFSACSLTNNTFDSTDQNYRSIWARDGSITVIQSLGLEDEDVRHCQEKTLSTLLDNISDLGQVPSNVSILSGSPDYSGVGGICSIDSGLWLVIAFYHYIRETRDYEFLRRWAPEIRRIMLWLSAHDSNNDTLLEIPEAGDWMDLFGHSYNVLYDEVLWFYCNLCSGRVEELLGRYNEAGTFLRKAQEIKETINRSFWPSERSEILKNFSEQQFSIGDTHYLIAEITPFGFDWRCDVLANILAALFNVLSIDRAHKAFRFMWGVGVNEPAPVANLYPPVSAGDPDWRPYFTVNLLNLPHHYHNGGIWPFIGSYWVQFISRLGMKDLAGQELYRLAQVNEKGVAGDWEFNEWVHGLTGRPLGKSFQAWSAAGYIKAYRDLKLSFTPV
ncbi:MAG: HAD-IIB family hydrolase [Spirochaetales bacterium]|nr:HAD-IIB family hydrolase [Spirochaetales bacterium]